jgi:hypothetical protein
MDEGVGENGDEEDVDAEKLEGGSEEGARVIVWPA